MGPRIRVNGATNIEKSSRPIPPAVRPFAMEIIASTNPVTTRGGAMNQTSIPMNGIEPIKQPPPTRHHPQTKHLRALSRGESG